jgi:hypothetical protein
MKYTQSQTTTDSPMSVLPLKQQAHALVDNLPESPTWDDLAYEAELRASIDCGLADSEAGRVVAIEDMMREFGVEE